MILEKNNLQTAKAWTKSYIELIASYVHPKTGNYLRSHLLRARMALDHRILIRPTVKKNSKITYTASRFSLLQWEPWRVFEWTLTELRSNIIKNLLCLFFILKWFNARHFEYCWKHSSLNDWKQSAQRLKLRERLLTINKRNIIRWNI